MSGVKASLHDMGGVGVGERTAQFIQITQASETKIICEPKVYISRRCFLYSGFQFLCVLRNHRISADVSGSHLGYFKSINQSFSPAW